MRKSIKKLEIFNQVIWRSWIERTMEDCNDPSCSCRNGGKGSHNTKVGDESFKVGDWAEENDNRRYYGWNNFIVGYRFLILGLKDKAIRNIESAINEFNKIEEKTNEDLELLDSCKRKLRDIITGEPQFSDQHFELDNLYDRFSLFYTQKIEPNMSIDGVVSKTTPKKHKHFTIQEHKKITGDLFKNKWK